MDGQKQIADMMEGYRNNPPKSINGVEVVQLLDYELKKGTDLQTGKRLEDRFTQIERFAVYTGGWNQDFSTSERNRTKDKILFQREYNAGQCSGF